jgi:nitric-oxide synthase
VSGSPLARRLRRLTPLERLEEAWAFQRMFCASHGIGKTAARRRWAEVSRQVLRHAFTEHTPEELHYGARVAWRNHARCIGRLFWESLTVFDCRSDTTVDAIAQRLGPHLAFALGDGRIRSAITIFPPVRGATLPPYIESAQLTQYAGYVLPHGQTLGDRKNIEVTRIATALGWRPPDEPGPFDLLPCILRDERDRRVLVELPGHVVREIDISHPETAALAELGLRWYAVPVVSDMILTIGGVDYPCAPFNGFYMATEIASRNLADRNRYDLLPEVARTLGLGPDKDLWQDTALTELNRAVVHSFHRAGVTLVDHHAASAQFMDFHARETAEGRSVSAEWGWIVPPQAPAACEVFHLAMTDLGAVPNYYRSRGEDGAMLMPYYGDTQRSRLVARLDRSWRRWKLRGRGPTALY